MGQRSMVMMVQRPPTQEAVKSILIYKQKDQVSVTCIQQIIQTFLQIEF